MPSSASATAKPSTQILDLDSNTRVTYTPGKQHISIFSEEGCIRLKLAEVTAIAAFLTQHSPA